MASENNLEPPKKCRGLALVFSMQGFGTLLCSLVLVIATQFVADPNLQWRIALSAGAVPMLIAFYFRWNMEETEEWKKMKNDLEYVKPVRNLSLVRVIKCISLRFCYV